MAIFLLDGTAAGPDVGGPLYRCGPASTSGPMFAKEYEVPS